MMCVCVYRLSRERVFQISNLLWQNEGFTLVIKEIAKFDINNSPMGNGINLMVVVLKGIITVWKVRLFVFAANMYIDRIIFDYRQWCFLAAKLKYPFEWL